MADNTKQLKKTARSASIGAANETLENAIKSLPLDNSTTDSTDTGTPNMYRRRRPATRTQSARITNTTTRSVRRKVQMNQQTNLQESRSHCTSEPKLSEAETPPQRRKLSQRRPQPQNPHRKSNAFLDVPTANVQHLRVSNDEDLDRLRTFSASKGGIINRGDSFRRRRSRSNSLVPVSPIHPRAGALAGCTDYDINTHDYQHQEYYHLQQQQQQQQHHQQKQQQYHHHHQKQHQQQQQQQEPVDIYHVQMLGAAGVGKQALLSQFRTSDCINAYDGLECDEGEQNISIILNNIESELKFCINKQENKEELDKADAFLVVYSCIDKESFTRSKQILSRLQDLDLIRTRPIILVANKIDLARSRAVSPQDGKCLACTFGTKFIEVSVGINHNCDELLAGTLTQIRLKKDQNLLQLKSKTKIKTKALSKDKHNIHHFDHHHQSLNVKNHDNNHELSGDKFTTQEKKSNDTVMGTNDSSTSPAHWYKSRSVMMASMKARQMLTWILGKEDSKFKNCENLQVL